MNRTLIGSIILLYKSTSNCCFSKESALVSPSVFSNLNRTQNPAFNFSFSGVNFLLPVSVYHMWVSCWVKAKLIFHLLKPWVRLQRRFFESFKNCFSYICKYKRQLLQSSLVNGNILFKNFNFLFVYNII